MKVAGMMMLTAMVGAGARAGEIDLVLQTRDPQTNEIVQRTETVNPAKIGFVVVDLWNYHWCMTWTHQVGAAVPRFNEAARAARRLGMQVFWAPSDVANAKTGWPQRERAMAVPYVDVPEVQPGFTIPFHLQSGSCHCGPGIPCLCNYGHDDMPADVDIGPDDLIVAGTREMYSNCRALGLTHLIYAGGATNICLTHKPSGLMPMYRAGLECFIARDLSEAWTHYDPESGHTPETGNAEAVADVERAGVASLHMEQTFRALGVWNEAALVREVRFSPWGKEDRPYLFDDAVKVTIRAEGCADCSIHYTTDGSTPDVGSPVYEGPLDLSATTRIRAAALSKGRRISPVSDGHFVRLAPVPPEPDVYLDTMEPLPDPYGQHSPTLDRCLWHPVVNAAFTGEPLRMRKKEYERGLGMRAPSNARYELKPECKVFVALAGTDDRLWDTDQARNVAMHASVVFKVFVDGRLAAESPVMRFFAEPWRFRLALPEGARQIDLVATDAGTRSAYDFGDWVQAGFLLQE